MQPHVAAHRRGAELCPLAVLHVGHLAASFTAVAILLLTLIRPCDARLTRPLPPPPPPPLHQRLPGRRRRRLRPPPILGGSGAHHQQPRRHRSLCQRSLASGRLMASARVLASAIVCRGCHHRPPRLERTPTRTLNILEIRLRAIELTIKVGTSSRGSTNPPPLHNRALEGRVACLARKRLMRLESRLQGRKMLPKH